MPSGTGIAVSFFPFMSPLGNQCVLSSGPKTPTQKKRAPSRKIRTALGFVGEDLPTHACGASVENADEMCSLDYLLYVRVFSVGCHLLSMWVSNSRQPQERRSDVHVRCES